MNARRGSCRRGRSRVHSAKQLPLGFAETEAPVPQGRSRSLALWANVAFRVYRQATAGLKRHAPHAKFHALVRGYFSAVQKDRRIPKGRSRVQLALDGQKGINKVLGSSSNLAEVASLAVVPVVGIVSHSYFEVGGKPLNLVG